MFLRNIFLLSFMGVCLCVAHSHHNKCKGTGPVQKPLTLCQELQLIRDLAPRASVIALIRNHMAKDSKFRRAVRFMQNSQFQTTVALIDETTIFKTILNEFVNAGIDITDINGVGKIFNCLVMPLINEATSARSSFSLTGSVPETRSLDTFANELVGLIPLNDLVKTITTQKAQNPQFAEFFDVVRDPSFRDMVLNGFIDTEISRPVKKLRHYQIDLVKLVKAAFSVIYSVDA